MHLGELSAAGRALTEDPFAAGGSDTLAELRDPQRRPQEPHASSSHLPQQAFLDSLRSARRGSGPASLVLPTSSDVLLDEGKDARLLHGTAPRPANAEVPLSVRDGM